METRLEYIFTKYNIVEEDQIEIIGIFNKSLIEISEGILGKKKETLKEKGEEVGIEEGIRICRREWNKFRGI